MYMSKKYSKKEKFTENVYNTNISDRIKKATQKQAELVKKTGYAQQFDTLMVDNTDNIPVGINQSNNTTSGYNVSLQRDIDFDNDYSEFSKTQMHYDVVNKKELFSSNMAPFTAHREFKQNSDYSHVLGLHTGQDEYYMSRENFTPNTLFEPMKNLTYVNGAPVFTDVLEERYIPSYKNNMGKLPFKTKLRVKPGLEGKDQKLSLIHI